MFHGKGKLRLAACDSDDRSIVVDETHVSSSLW